MARKLKANVYVGTEWYGPAYGNADQVPDEVAEKIGDHAWEDDEPEAGEAPVRRRGGRRRAPENDS